MDGTFIRSVAHLSSAYQNLGSTLSNVVQFGEAPLPRARLGLCPCVDLAGGCRGGITADAIGRLKFGAEWTLVEPGRDGA